MKSGTGRNFILDLPQSKYKMCIRDRERESGYDRYYTNIEIRQGDSLWSIAERYRANSGMEVRQYISELKEINGLVSDSIEAGDSLTVVYYARQPGMIPSEQ